MDPEFVEAFLKTIDCYVMGSRTYETALDFEAKGFGWSYGDKPTFVLTHRELPRTRDTVELYSGDLAQFVNGRLRPAVPQHLVRRRRRGLRRMPSPRTGRRSALLILPVLIGDGIPFFEKLDKDVALHLRGGEGLQERHGGASLRGEAVSPWIVNRPHKQQCSSAPILNRTEKRPIHHHMKRLRRPLDRSSPQLRSRDSSSLRPFLIHLPIRSLKHR